MVQNLPDGPSTVQIDFDSMIDPRLATLSIAIDEADYVLTTVINNVPRARRSAREVMRAILKTRMVCSLI